MSLIFSREGNHPGDCNEITYGQLLVEVCRFANVLKAKGMCCRPVHYTCFQNYITFCKCTLSQMNLIVHSMMQEFATACLMPGPLNILSHLNFLQEQF